MNKQKLADSLNKVLNFLTPIKSAGIALIILAIVDHLAQVPHIPDLPSWAEFLVRSLFFFCGFFVLFGNGKTAQIRAFIVSVPFLYLGILYLASFIVSPDRSAILIPTLLSIMSAMWLLFRGYKYE